MQSNIHLPSFIQCIHTLLDLPTTQASQTKLLQTQQQQQPSMRRQVAGVLLHLTRVGPRAIEAMIRVIMKMPEIRAVMGVMIKTKVPERLRIMKTD